MNNTEQTPVWVRLAFSNITTRKGALLLILASVVFTVYCVPWPRLVTTPHWLEKLLVADDWSWFATMVAITIWYWLGLRWIDRHRGWADTPD